MKLWSTVPLGLLLTMVVFDVRGIAGEDAQDTQGRTVAIENQFEITLPDGWSVYNQDEAISGKASPLGMVFFSALPVTQPGSTTADAALLAKVDTGETVSFFVDRSKASKSMSCMKMSKSDIYGIGTTINRDPAIATAGRRLFGGGLEPHHEDIDVGGCRGLRYQMEANKNDPAKHWKLEVRAVSDGQVLYLFSVRHRGVHYDDNFAAFDKAMSTVHFKQAK